MMFNKKQTEIACSLLMSRPLCFSTTAWEREYIAHVTLRMQFCSGLPGDKSYWTQWDFGIRFFRLALRHALISQAFKEPKFSVERLWQAFGIIGSYHVTSPWLRKPSGHGLWSCPGSLLWDLWPQNPWSVKSTNNEDLLYLKNFIGIFFYLGYILF